MVLVTWGILASRGRLGLNIKRVFFGYTGSFPQIFIGGARAGIRNHATPAFWEPVASFIGSFRYKGRVISFRSNNNL